MVDIRYREDCAFFAGIEQCQISAFGYFVVGACRAKVEKSAEELIALLLDIEASYEFGLLDGTTRMELYESIYSADLLKVASILEPFKEYKESFLQLSKFLPRPEETDTQSLMLIDQLLAEDQAQFEEAKFDCPICLVSMTYQETIPLQFCGDLFHHECIAKHISTQISDGNLAPSCPSCKLPLSDLDINQRLDPEQRIKFQRLSVNRVLDTNPDALKRCMTPDCQFAFVYNGEADFTCELCSKRYCLKCMTDYHPQFTCEEYRQSHDPTQLDNMFQRFVEGAHFKQCLNCHFFVEKTMGCNHMTCRCTYQFCYSCGGRYGACSH